MIPSPLPMIRSHLVRASGIQCRVQLLWICSIWIPSHKTLSVRRQILSITMVSSSGRRGLKEKDAQLICTLFQCLSFPPLHPGSCTYIGNGSMRQRSSWVRCSQAGRAKREESPVQMLLSVPLPFPPSRGLPVSSTTAPPPSFSHPHSPHLHTLPRWMLRLVASLYLSCQYRFL